MKASHFILLTSLAGSFAFLMPASGAFAASEPSSPLGNRAVSESAATGIPGPNVDEDLPISVDLKPLSGAMVNIPCHALNIGVPYVHKGTGNGWPGVTIPKNSWNYKNVGYTVDSEGNATSFYATIDNPTFIEEVGQIVVHCTSDVSQAYTNH